MSFGDMFIFRCPECGKMMKIEVKKLKEVTNDG